VKITPTNLTKHELVGLQAHIISSKDPNHVCQSGIVVGETKKMLHLKTSKGEKKVPKDICIFDLTLPDDSTIRVNGGLLYGRPEDRMKRRARRRW
jgi:ribonuclease P protein subunit POP4